MSGVKTNNVVIRHQSPFMGRVLWIWLLAAVVGGFTFLIVTMGWNDLLSPNAILPGLAMVGVSAVFSLPAAPVLFIAFWLLDKQMYPQYVKRLLMICIAASAAALTASLWESTLLNQLPADTLVYVYAPIAGLVTLVFTWRYPVTSKKRQR
jgi:hypothetical protein